MALFDTFDIIVEAITKLETKGVKPAYVIIGELQVNEIYDDIRNRGAVLSVGYSEDVTILGYPLVFDPEARSRVTAVGRTNIRDLTKFYKNTA